MHVNLFVGAIFLAVIAFNCYSILRLRSDLAFLEGDVDRAREGWKTLYEQEGKQHDEMDLKITNLYNRIVEVENSLIAFKAKINKKKVDKK